MVRYRQGDLAIKELGSENKLYCINTEHDDLLVRPITKCIIFHLTKDYVLAFFGLATSRVEKKLFYCSSSMLNSIGSSLAIYLKSFHMKQAILVTICGLHLKLHVMLYNTPPYFARLL